MKEEVIIKNLLQFSSDIRYAALYIDGKLFQDQHKNLEEASDYESDKYEELLVNPALLTLAQQRGNIDCGGLDFLVVSYGNFYQLIRNIHKGHISICLDKGTDLNSMPGEISRFLNMNYPQLLSNK